MELNNSFPFLPENFLPSLQNFLFSLGEKISKLQKSNLQIEIKQDGSKVTKSDLLAEKKIIEFLKKYNYPIISEESENPELTDELTWAVDPIDGTSSYIRQNESFSIMIGLLKNKKPILGVIYLPAKEMGYYAFKNQGSYRYEKNLKATRLQINPLSTKEKVLVINQKEKLKEWESQLIQSFNIKKVESMGSIGIKLAKIAEGKAHYYFKLSSRFGIWDLVAPIIILEEAGGFVRNAKGNSISFKLDTYREGLIATYKDEFDTLFDQLKQFDYSK